MSHIDKREVLKRLLANQLSLQELEAAVYLMPGVLVGIAGARPYRMDEEPLPEDLVKYRDTVSQEEKTLTVEEFWKEGQRYSSCVLAIIVGDVLKPILREEDIPEFL